jgi:WW domain
MDRLYVATARPGGRPPVFPFEKVVVQPVKTAGLAVTTPTPTAGTTNVTATKVNAAATAVRTTQPAVQQSVLQQSVTTQSVVQQSVTTQSVVQQSVVQQSVVQPVAGGRLPSGWAQGVDQATGRVYYYHTASGQSQWEPPVSVSEPTPTQSVLKQLPSPARGAVVSADPFGARVNALPSVASAVPHQQTTIQSSAQTAQAANPTPQPKTLLPDSEGVLLLEQVIATVSGTHTRR